MHMNFILRTDVDECAKKGICHQHAQCFNTPGRFYCECSHGFTGNGTVCSELSANAEQGLIITTQNIPILTTQREVLTEHVESTNSNSDTSGLSLHICFSCDKVI